MNVKRVILILIPTLFFMGCAGLQRTVPEIQTVKTDLEPSALSRSQYYEQMGLALAHEGQTDKATEFLQLSLLHDPENVSARIALAGEYLKNGRRHMAINELDAAYKLQPGHITVLNKMAELYVSSGIYSKAREVYEYVLSFKPNDKKSRWALVHLAQAENRPEEAHRYLGELKALPSDSSELAQIYFTQAEIYRSEKDMPNFSAKLTEAYTLNPRQREITGAYAAWLTQQKQFDRATHVLNGYAQTQPYDHKISQSLADSSVRSGHYEIALNEIEKQLDSDEAKYLALSLKKAHVYHLMGNTVKAKAQYEDILEMTENDEAQFYLAQLQNQDLPAERRKAVQLLSEISPASDYYGKASAILADWQYEQGDAEKAFGIMETAYETRPDQMDVYRTYGALLLKESQFVKAASVLKNGVAEFPQDENLRLQAAFAYYRTGQFKQFDQQIRTVASQNPQNADVYALLAELWHEDGKNLNELSFLVKKAAELKSENKNIKPILAWVLMQQNHTPEAVALFEEAYEQDPKQAFLARSLAQIYSAADVQTKAREMSRVAAALEVNHELKSGVKNEDMFLSTRQTLRMPANMKD